MVVQIHQKTNLGKEDFREKWRTYYQSKPDFDETHQLDEITPFYGTEHFVALSKEDRSRLFFEYIKMVGEALILFEKILLYSARHNARLLAGCSSKVQEDHHRVGLEELYHLKGLNHFLSLHPLFRWREAPIYSDAHRLKNAFAWIMKHFPTAIYLPGAKLEAFTISYYNMLKKAYAHTSGNSWTQFNHLHMQDEISHLPMQFDFHDATVDKEGFLKTWIGSILFVGLLQIALALGSFKVITRSLPGRSFLSRLRWTLRMAKWAVRTTASYKEGRALTKKLFASRKPKYGSAFSYIHW